MFVAFIFSGSTTSFTTAFVALQFRFWHSGIPVAVEAPVSDDARQLQPTPNMLACQARPVIANDAAALCATKTFGWNRVALVHGVAKMGDDRCRPLLLQDAAPIRFMVRITALALVGLWALSFCALAHAQYLEGYEAYLKGDPDYAEQTFRRALEEQPPDRYGFIFVISRLANASVHFDKRGYRLPSKEMIRLLSQAARDGPGESLWKIYLIYSRFPDPVDQATKLDVLSSAARAGHLEAQYELARKLDSSPEECRQSLELLLRAANGGHVEAQSLLGLIYANQGWLYGMSCKRDEPDFTAAYTWALKAAERGSARAQALAGRLLFEGKGTRQDYAAAFKWSQRAFENGAGDPRLLARMYDEGLGVPKNSVTAKRLWGISMFRAQPDVVP